MKLKATYTPRGWKEGTGFTGGGIVDGEPQTVMIIQITQYPEYSAEAIFVDGQGKFGGDSIRRFSNIEGAW